jgi:transposase
MGNYLKMSDKRRVLALLELGWAYRRIERETGVRRETIARYDPRRQPKAAKVSTGWQESSDNVSADAEVSKAANLSVGSGGAHGPPGLAAPFHAQIEAGLRHGLTAQRIWQDLCAEVAYPHSYASVRRYVRRLKHAHPKLVDVMEHPPGEEGQVDFFQGPPTFDEAQGRWRRPWIFRLTLSCSKHGYEEPLWTQERDGFLRAHEHAFVRLGGVPKVVRHDNLKAAVVRACLYDPDVSEVYAAFAAHWGFVPLPSRPRHPQENGVAERSGGYVKSNALKGLRFDSLQELAEFLERWNRTVAQVRIHGTTRQQVLKHFLEVEQPALQPLPAEPFGLFQVGNRTVHPDGHVEVDGAFYSVPHTLVGQQVRAQWNGHLVRVYRVDADGQRQAVAVHLHVKAGAYSTRREHRPLHRPARQAAYEAILLGKAEHIGPHALAWAQAVIVERGVRAYRLLQGLISLTRNHPRERVDWACGYMLQYRLFRYGTLRRLIEQAAAQTPMPKLLQEHAVIRDLSVYAQLV